MYKPLTPKLRDEIIARINAQRAELNTCQQTTFVSDQKMGLDALESLIRGLPDGYPILIEKEN